MFSRSKIYKYLAFTFILSSIFGIIIYNLLANRHKAIVKTILFHKTGILNGDWSVFEESKLYKMHSPTFLVDGIYKSMEGPKASRYVQLSSKKELQWITGFSVKALEDKTNKPLSNDYICHMNVDINDAVYYDNFGLKDRIGRQYPRLTSLSHGLESFHFPEGFAVPIYGNDFLNVTTQTLNHNIKNINLKVKHEVEIHYQNNTKPLKPLLSKTAFLQLPFDYYNPNKQPLDPTSNQCIPVETKNHTYVDANGNYLSGHWKIPMGKKEYRSNINEHLSLEKPMQLHFAAPHVHPYATSIGIYDKTEDKMLFTCPIINHKNSIGLTKIGTFSSTEGITLFPNHEYEMVMTVNNTSNIEQDMMGSMFLFFYDEELNQKLKK